MGLLAKNASDDTIMLEFSVTDGSMGLTMGERRKYCIVDRLGSLFQVELGKCALFKLLDKFNIDYSKI